MRFAFTMLTIFTLSLLELIKSLTHYAKGTLVQSQLLIIFKNLGCFTPS